MRSIGVVTVGRSDYSIYRPLLRLLAGHPDFELRLLVSGMHLDKRHGHTVDVIVQDGFAIHARVPVLQEKDTAEAVAQAVGVGVGGFSTLFAQSPPDLLVLLGDRFEMFAAGVAAIPFNIPILHLHGGELTEGAMDDRFRHSLTKMSHLHAVAADECRRRVLQLGEEPWRVIVSGALALDSVRTIRRLARSELEDRFSLDLSTPPLLVTLHPTTSEHEQAGPQADLLLDTLREAALPVIFTMPNADMAGQLIRERILRFCSANEEARWVENFGPEGYFSILGEVAAMVGNSSSGLLEAPSFALPVVNIGSRQKGRLRAGNVIDVPFEKGAVLSALQKALSPEFKAACRGFEAFFGDGHAAEKIVEFLGRTSFDKRLLDKSFTDLAS